VFLIAIRRFRAVKLKEKKKGERKQVKREGQGAH
jgi:hypothetical protein